MNILVLIIGLLALIVVVLSILIILTMKRIKQLTRGESTISLESIIKENNRMSLEIKDTLKNQEHQIIQIKKDAMNTLQNVGVVRFNPFKETGGSQSFVVALTDKKNNGVVISSLYARERMSVFAKPIINGTSTYTLTDEEQDAINQSQK